MDHTEPPRPLTRNGRRRELTRRSLLDTGRGLITERGVAGLRIHEITERADVALGSFYNHFASKGELVDAVLGETLAELAASSVPEADIDADPATVVVGAIVRFMRLADTDPDFAQLLVNLNHAEALFLRSIHPYARTAVERGIASRRFVVVDIEVTVSAVMGAALALIREILAGHKTPQDDRAFSLHVLAALGLTPADAVEAWNRASTIR
ncbi:TetR/AcrR family transcriptional regulator [Nocardia sp. NPDC059239]|uniref:TetR/AcrR family transcriptional regulator n=1 Tax=unclassified Nocardia TaxID=2637762 RepID=UPI0036AA4789